MASTSLHRSVFVALLLPTLALSQLTIPRRSLGWVYKKSNATRDKVVTLTAYMDLTCPDSKQAYPTLLQVADKLYGQNFEFVFRSFDLPYHRNSHLISSTIHLLQTLIGGEGYIFPFISEVYEKNNILVGSSTKDMNDEQVVDVVAGIVTDVANISAAFYKQEITKRSYDLAARLDFKYGCTRGIYGTPMFMVNDVLVSATQDWTVKQWIDLIQPLLI